MRPVRTVLEQKIRDRRQTLEEFAEFAETFAREHNEPGHIGVRHLQRLASGRGPKGQPLGRVTPQTARLLENIFDISIDELLSPPGTTESADDSTAELRQMLHASSQIDDSIVQLLREQLTSVRRLDRQLGAVVAHDEVRAKTEQVTRLLRYSLFGETRENLAGLLSDLHTLAGWQSLDLGKVSESWQHYEHAKSAARESGSLPFEVHAAGEQAFVLLDAGEISSAVDLLESARESAKRTCPSLLRAWLAAAHGEALAEYGRYDESRRAFDAARTLLSIDSTESEAVDVLTGALNHLDSSFTRAETALRIDLASALVSVGSLDEARIHTQRAGLLADRIGSVRQQRRIRSMTAQQ